MARSHVQKVAAFPALANWAARLDVPAAAVPTRGEPPGAAGGGRPLWAAGAPFRAFPETPWTRSWRMVYFDQGFVFKFKKRLLGMEVIQHVPPVR